MTDVEKMKATVAMLREALKSAFQKWDQLGGPHAAAEHCGNLVGTPCVCGLAELENAFVEVDSDVEKWLSERDARTRDAALEEGIAEIEAVFLIDQDVSAIEVLRVLKGAK